MDANTIAIIVGGIGGLLAAVGSLIGALHLHAKSKCCGKRVQIDIDADRQNSPTSSTPLVNEANKKIESEKS